MIKTTKNCITCNTRIKASSKWDENKGDFWHCTAVVPIPAFGVMWLENRHKNPDDPYSVSRLININIFRPDHEQYKHGMNNDCPLWSQ